jgi:hypothetical protein
MEIELQGADLLRGVDTQLRAAMGHLLSAQGALP